MSTHGVTRRDLLKIGAVGVAGGALTISGLAKMAADAGQAERGRGRGTGWRAPRRPGGAGPDRGRPACARAASPSPRPSCRSAARRRACSPTTARCPARWCACAAATRCACTCATGSPAAAPTPSASSAESPTCTRTAGTSRRRTPPTTSCGVSSPATPGPTLTTSAGSPPAPWAGTTRTCTAWSPSSCGAGWPGRWWSTTPTDALERLRDARARPQGLHHRRAGGPRPTRRPWTS